MQHGDNRHIQATYQCRERTQLHCCVMPAQSAWLHHKTHTTTSPQPPPRENAYTQTQTCGRVSEQVCVGIDLLRHCYSRSSPCSWDWCSWSNMVAAAALHCRPSIPCMSSLFHVHMLISFQNHCLLTTLHACLSVCRRSTLRFFVNCRDCWDFFCVQGLEWQAQAGVELCFGLWKSCHAWPASKSFVILYPTFSSHISACILFHTFVSSTAWTAFDWSFDRVFQLILAVFFWSFIFFYCQWRCPWGFYVILCFMWLCKNYDKSESPALRLLFFSRTTFSEAQLLFSEVLHLI